MSAPRSRDEAGSMSKACIVIQLGLLTFTFETEEAARSHILSFGSLMEVLEPQELRKRMEQIAAMFLTFYQKEPIE
jgi:predicted DNA-binding transcriptional regulator YafY